MSVTASIAALSRHQISAFFNNPQVTATQAQCNEAAARLTGQPDITPTPSPVQGGGSYTVIAGAIVVQFRRKESALDLVLLAGVERSYAGFVPRHALAGEPPLSGLLAYTMNDIGGVSMYLAREELWQNEYHLLRRTLKDYARFFASAWHNTPASISSSADRSALFADYSTQLTQLAHGLPSRFRPTLEHLLTHLPSLFLDDWPMVVNHIDLLENNIHVDPQTGALMGVCDWKDAVVGPFGISLSGLETMLGLNTYSKGWCYHEEQESLRGVFWEEFYGHVGQEHRERVEIARVLGVFLGNGWQHNNEGERVPAWVGTIGLNYLDAVILGVQGTEIVWN